MQDAIGAVHNGAITLKALVVDGIGGVTVAGTAGTVKVSKVAAAATTPTAALTVGEIARGSNAMGWGKMNSGGTVAGVHNVFATSRLGLGQYKITLQTAPSAVGLISIGTTPINTACIPVLNTTGTAINAGKLEVEIDTYDVDGVTLIDAAFCFVIYGD